MTPAVDDYGEPAGSVPEIKASRITSGPESWLGYPVGGATPPAPQRLFLVVPHPNPGRQTGIEPDEPGVGIVVGGAGLSGQGSCQPGGGCRGASLHDTLQQTSDDVGGVGADGARRLGVSLFQQVPVSVGDLGDEVGPHPYSLIREGGIGGNHFQEAGLRGAQG